MGKNVSGGICVPDSSERRAPVLIGEFAAADCSELNELADYFALRGVHSNAEFLREVARRHAEFFKGYADHLQCVEHKVSQP